MKERDKQMLSTVKEEIQRVKALTSDELDELLGEILADEDLRQDLLDVALALEAEAAGGEPVTLEEYIAGKRTY
ncbi:MAG: hypothetical protein V2A61_06130 [Calditrichota bacterium]